MEDEKVVAKEDTTGNDLLNPDHKSAADWFTKLATVERAKALRRESQKARKGKRLTFSKHRGWSQFG